MSMESSSSADDLILLWTRALEEEKGGGGASTRGRTVLTVLYLCVLGLCFVTPLLYYCRIRYEELNMERMREMEAAAIRGALEDSDQQQREEAAAVRRKYIDERRARILQLFEPVRMILKEENFPDSKEGPTDSDPEKQKTDASIDSNDEEPADGGDDEEDEGKNQSVVSLELAAVTDNDEASDYEFDDDAPMIWIPLPGLEHVTSTSGTPQSEHHLVPGVCTICLSRYKVGSDVVWSSNSKCDHVFHEECIERWIMKQREGPLCPCCRREFIVDPYDIEEGLNNENATNEDALPQIVWNRDLDIDDEEEYNATPI